MQILLDITTNISEMILDLWINDYSSLGVKYLKLNSLLESMYNGELIFFSELLLFTLLFQLLMHHNYCSYSALIQFPAWEIICALPATFLREKQRKFRVWISAGEELMQLQIMPKKKHLSAGRVSLILLLCQMISALDVPLDREY